MRAYVLLIATAVVNAFAAGGLFLTTARGLQPIDGVNVGLLRAEFEGGRARELTLDLGSLVPRIDGSPLLDPESTLPTSQRYPREELGALLAYARDCDRPPVVSPALQKALIWHRVSCGRGELPPDFFETPPFMHPAGVSYALLAADRGHDWIIAHQRLLHVSEWRFGADPPRELLASSGRATLAALVAGDPLVLDARHVFIAHGQARPSYAVYPRRNWDAFIAGAPLIARPDKDPGACVVREGHICWARNEAPFFARLSRLTVMLLGLSLASALVATGLLVRRGRAQREAEERERFVLQTLTHELRTPVASLLVGLETLRAGFDEEALLRAVDDVQRLRRLTEKSRAYLTQGNALRLERVPLPSAGDWVSERVGTSARVEVLQDGPVSVDPYWLGLSIENLVQNALRHGAAPVVVSVRRGERRLSVEVRDAGTLGRSRSPGLGLGLFIVRRAAAAMGGTLKTGEAPTRFTLEVPA